MKQHEREFFIYKIRSGKVFLENNIVINPPSIDQNIQSCIVYEAAYDEARADGFKTHDEIMDWLIEKNIWSGKEEGNIKFFTKDVEKFRVEMYENRHEKKKYNKIRLYLRKAESELQKLLIKKHSYYENSCEGVAQTEKISWLTRNCAYQNGSPCKFQDTPLERVMSLWQSDGPSDQQIRELARNDPWSSLWNASQKTSIKLFYNDELTIHQKQLMVWSQTYDNVYESMECPPTFVIQDDDLLDGWFITQSRKRDEEKKKEDIEKRLGKNADKQEVFLMGKNDKEQIKYIEDFNTPDAVITRKSRAKALSEVEKGTEIQHIDLPDVQRDLKIEANKIAMERMKNG